MLIPHEDASTQPGSQGSPAASAPATSPASAAEILAKRTTQREVVAGVDDGTHCEIVSGLKEGEKVAISSVGQEEWAKLKTNNDEGF